ncbi:hypothetical protein AB3N59_05310 [Leptospira sp. WS92.C1]
MHLKRIVAVFVLSLALLLSNCGDKDKKDPIADLALLLALQPQSLGVSGVFASMNIQTGEAAAAAAGNYTKSVFSPLALIDQTVPCSLGGSMRMSGDVVLDLTNPIVIQMQLNDATIAFSGCKQTIPMLEGSGVPVIGTLEGSVQDEGIMIQTMDATSTATLQKYTVNGAERLRSSTYKVNGVLYPTFDLIFTRNNAKMSIENPLTLTNAFMNIEDDVTVTGTFGDETINSHYTYKTRFKLLP